MKYYMDETRIQCNKEEGKLPGSESFMWVMRSAASEENQAAFFFYSRSRSGENARKLLKSFDGYLITDAYSSYDTGTTLGSDRASSKGCAIRQVEILPNKLLTTAFEASLGCVAVM